MNYQEESAGKSAAKLKGLREVMASQGFGGLLIPKTDEYLGEYVPACAERLAWLTGFTGSAGLAVILQDQAMVMSDGRYTIQLAQQVDADLYALENSQTIKPEEWLEENVSDGTIIGYDPKLHTAAQIDTFEKAGVILKPAADNLIDHIWADRPAPPQGKVTLFPQKFAGQSAAEKIKNIQAQLKEYQADYTIITMADSIAWLFNIRGNDVPHIPVALSYAIIPQDGVVQWFIDPAKMTDEVRAALAGIVEGLDHNKLPNVLKELAEKHVRVALDPKRASIWFKIQLEQYGAEILEQDDPCILPRACKNAAEQAAMKAAHVRDALAMVKFLAWFDAEAPKENLTELSVEKKLQEFRAQAKEFRQPSFSTIAGYGANGAIVHYRANEKSSLTIKKDNLLLLDSGAQYEDGTTDITRTIAVGMPGEEMCERFTLVLKGHIALADHKFPRDTQGKALDALARAPLQAVGLNYAHGTGHGVGCYLSVHEDAASFSPRGEEPVLPGMIISNEPGYYKEGGYGIRIESLVLVKEEGGQMFFETITLVPIDRRLIVADMLSAVEKDWLNAYHVRVYETLADQLDDVTAAWLKQATTAV